METTNEHNGKTFFIIEMETCRILPCVYEYSEKTQGHPKTRYITKNHTLKVKSKKRDLVIPYYREFKLEINPVFTKKRLNQYFSDLETKGSARIIKGVESIRQKTYIVAFDDEAKAKHFLKEVIIPCQIERRLMYAETFLKKYNDVVSELAIFEKIKETL